MLKRVSDGNGDIAGMKVDYRVDHFKINSFSLNTSEVTFNLQLGKITIDSKQDQVEMSFRWKFETDLLHVGDSGTGVGSSDNVHMTLALKIASLSSVKVISCSLIVSDLGTNTARALPSLTRHPRTQLRHWRK